MPDYDEIKKLYGLSRQDYDVIKKTFDLRDTYFSKLLKESSKQELDHLLQCAKSNQDIIVLRTSESTSGLEDKLHRPTPRLVIQPCKNFKWGQPSHGRPDNLSNLRTTI